MKIAEFEQKHNVTLMLKKKSWHMRFVGFFLGKNFMEHFWSTFRLPFQKKAIIVYPDSNDLSGYEEIPEWAMGILNHELIHVKDMSTGWGLFKMFWLLWLLPLPTIFSGRWYIERYAYLNDIKVGRKTVESAADTLWSGYWWCWPKSLMRKWFNKKIKE